MNTKAHLRVLWAFYLLERERIICIALGWTVFLNLLSKENKQKSPKLDSKNGGG